jgi:hypothetical protein
VSEAQRSGAQRSARAAGQFVKRASETDGGRVPETAIRELAIPCRGKGRLRHLAGEAGPFATPRGGGLFARGMEARQGRDTERSEGLDAKHDSPAPRSGDAQWLRLGPPVRPSLPKHRANSDAGSTPVQ